MGQEQIRSQLLRLYNVISGKSLTVEEIVKSRNIPQDFSLNKYSELGGMVPSGKRVLVEEYGTLEDKLDYGTQECAR